MPRPTPNPLFLVRILFAVAAIAAVRAQPEYALREWHTRDGLPSEEVSRICQDPAGFLWLATSGGLVRFDGAQFLPVLSEGRELRPAPSFAVMAQVPRLGLVVAPFRGGVAVYTAGAYRMIVPAALIAERRVFALFAENEDTFWVALEDGTLLRHRAGETRRFKPIPGPGARSLPTFAIDRGGVLWITRGSSLVRFLGGELVPLELDFGNSPLRAAASRSGGLWIVTRERVHRFDGARLDAGIPVLPLLGAHFIQDLREDRNGALWIATRSKGVHRVSDGRVNAMRVSHEDAYSLLEDAEGNMWLGTNGGGLNRLRVRTSRLYDTSTGLSGNYSYTVCEDASGAIWLANRDGGAAKIVDGAVDVLSRRSGWPSFSALSAAPDPRGGIWVSSGIGLYRVHGGDRLERKMIRSGPDPLVRVMFTARNGDVWFAYQPHSIGRIRGGEHIELLDANAGFEGRQVRCIGEDRDGGVWAGTADGRLYRFDGERFHRIAPPGAPLAPIQTMLCDVEGVLWFGTAGTGLLVRNTDGTWGRLESQHGLFADNLTQIVADDYGHLWFGSDRGIFRVSRRELVAALRDPLTGVHAVLMGEDSGLPDISCVGLYQPAAWKASDGRLWFATRRGVLALDPRPTRAEQQSPPVTIESVRIGGRPWPSDRPITLEAGSSAIEIGFSVVALSAPERVQVKYRMNGYDDDWTLARESRVARYARLPPGGYVFRVQATGGGGQGGPGEATVRLEVHPLWWQTWWFRAAALAALLGVVAVSARAWSHRRLRRRLERIEREHAIERERTRIAQNIHDDLGASLTRISLLTQSAQRGEPVQAARLDEIYEAAGEITRSMDEIVWAVNPKYDDLESFASYLGNFAQRFLRLAGLRCRLDLPSPMPAVALASQVRHHLFLCCKEALNNAVKHAGATEVWLSMRLEADRLTIRIADNGRGLGPVAGGAADANRDRASWGHGLENLRRRLAEMNGTCTLDTTPGGGTTIAFSFPVDGN